MPENSVRRLLDLRHASHMWIIDAALAKMDAELSVDLPKAPAGGKAAWRRAAFCPFPFLLISCIAPHKSVCGADSLTTPSCSRNVRSLAKVRRAGPVRRPGNPIP
jgi:hypothetical protein